MAEFSVEVFSFLLFLCNILAPINDFWCPGIHQECAHKAQKAEIYLDVAKLSDQSKLQSDRKI